MMAPPCEPPILQEIEVMADEPDSPLREKTIEEVRPHLVVEGTVDGLAHVVEERRCPEQAILRGTVCELEDLQRVEERIPFRVVSR